MNIEINDLNKTRTCIYFVSGFHAGVCGFTLNALPLSY
nr:MAG TPA: hypothetical protein [Bacteriophage sp.]